jgi:hypothetical protein
VAPKRTAKIGNKLFLTRTGFKIFGIPQTLRVLKTLRVS